MRTRKEIKEYQIVSSTEEEDGDLLFARIGKLAVSKNVHKALEGPLVHLDGTVWVYALHPSEGVVAIASLHTDTLQSKGIARLDNAYVMPEHRNNGLHHTLFEERLAIAQELGALIIQGWANGNSQKTFRSYGFVEQGRRGKWIKFERVISND